MIGVCLLGLLIPTQKNSAICEVEKHRQPIGTALTMRRAGVLLDKGKEQAKLKSMDYQEYERFILERI